MMNNDLDVDLVRTFDQMQTLDKEDLVGQMLRLVGGNGLTSEAAAFYLEMNAWNVQVEPLGVFLILATMMKDLQWR